MWIGHRREILKADVSSVSLSSKVLKLIRSEEGLTLETSALESLFVGKFTLQFL